MQDSSDNSTPGVREWQQDEISLVEVASTILRQWRLIVAVPLFLALVVGARTLSQDRTYSASASFIPQAAESQGGGGAAALAQQFGVSIGSGRPGQSPQFYVALLWSRAVLREAVESEYVLPAEDGTVRKADLIHVFNVETDGYLLPPWRLAADRLRRDISASVGRETGIVQLTVSASQPALAEQIAERLLEILNTFNTEVRQSSAQEESRFVSDRLRESQAELLTAEDALQEFLRHNRQFRNSPELMFEHDRLQRQVEMRQDVYTSLLRSQEQARIDAIRDTPLLTVLDHPAGTAEPRGRGTVVRTMLAFVLGLTVALGVAFVREANRLGRNSQDPRYREFQGLVRHTWADLRNPTRWLRSGRSESAAGSE